MQLESNNQIAAHHIKLFYIKLDFYLQDYVQHLVYNGYFIGELQVSLYQEENVHSFNENIKASMSLLPQLSSYTGMLLVGLFVPMLLKRKEQMALQYKMILSEEETDGHLFKDHVCLIYYP